MKRNLGHENIDIFFLLNENKILTPSELQRILPKEKYIDYMKGFYKRRFIDIFNKYYHHPWFKQKYLVEEKKIAIWNFEFKNTYFIISELDVEEDLNKLKTIDGYINHYQMIPNGQKLEVILEQENDKDIKEEIQKLFGDKVSMVRIEKGELAPRHRIANNDALQCLKTFYKINIDNIEDPLNKIFVFCCNCNKQYNSDIEMVYKCNKNCLIDTRRKEILRKFIDFDFLKSVQIDFVVKSNIIKYEENVYKCAYCEKKFESIDFIKLHYQNKHPHEITQREKKYENFMIFVSNIDLNMCYLADGTLEGKPWFASVGDNRRVVYDLNHFFSGEISI